MSPNESKINVAIIHGIGINTVGYADVLIKGIRQQFNKNLQHILGSKGDFSNRLEFVPIVWDDIVGPKEAKLADIFRKELKKRHRRTFIETLVLALTAVPLYFLFPRFFLLLLGLEFLAYFFFKIVYQLRTGFAAEYIADITSYNEKSAKDLILQRVGERVQPLAAGPNAVNITFISHSLGTVIASDFVWENQKPGGLLDSKLVLNNFFTMGSPLPLFSLQFGGPDVFTKPISVQDPAGRWVNIYDYNDPISYPLKPLNAAYDKVVLKDHNVRLGIFGIAHLKYWENMTVHKVMARKLALDWLRLNNKLEKDRLEKLYAAYDQC